MFFSANNGYTVHQKVPLQICQLDKKSGSDGLQVGVFLAATGTSVTSVELDGSRSFGDGGRTGAAALDEGSGGVERLV